MPGVRRFGIAGKLDLHYRSGMKCTFRILLLAAILSAGGCTSFRELNDPAEAGRMRAAGESPNILLLPFAFFQVIFDTLQGN